MSMRRRCSSRRLTRSTRSSVPADDRADVPPNCTQTRDTNRGRTGRPCADAASRRALPARVWSRRRDSAVIVGSSNVRTRGSTVSGSSRCGMNVAQTPMRHFSRLDALSSAGSSSNQSFVRRSKLLDEVVCDTPGGLYFIQSSAGYAFLRYRCLDCDLYRLVDIVEFWSKRHDHKAFH